MLLVLAGWGAGCAADPGPLAEACDPRDLAAGEVRARRIACDEERVVGGEGRVDDWLIENARARFVVRDTYAALTQLGEEGGTLVDAAEVGGVDLLMELVPHGDRGSVVAEHGDGFAELRLPGVVYRLEADTLRLNVEGPDGTWLAGTWVPLPMADHVDAVARGEGAFLALETAEALPPEADGWGQVPLSAFSGIALSPGDRWPNGDAFDVTLDADDVEVSVAGRVVDRVPVIDGRAVGVAPSGAVLTATREGCVYGGLAKVGCGGLTVRVRDDHGADLAATVHFGVSDVPLGAGGGRAPLGVQPGEVWVWAGPRYGAWHGWFTGGEDHAELVLPLAMAVEVEWEASPWPIGGGLLADFAVEAAPDANQGTLAATAIHALRGVGVGWATLVADDEVPVVEREAHDDVVVTSATRSHDVWAWGAISTTRRAAHGALDWAGFDALDRLTLVRGGLGTGRFTVVDTSWVEAGFSEAPQPWDWPVRPDALWLDSMADLPALEALANAWIDAQPVAARTWLPFVGAPNAAATERALNTRLASAGNGPRVDVAWRHTPMGQRCETLAVEATGPEWMGVLVATAHTNLGNFPVSLDSSGQAKLHVCHEDWVYVTVSAPRSRPWGGDPAWAVSALRWLGVGELGP